MKSVQLAHELETLKKQYSYRHRRALETPQGVEVKFNGKRYLSFCSNDYLGLANHPVVCAACHNAINEYGVGSGASQLISGYTRIHANLEQALADFLDYERVLLFSAGFLANLGVIDALSTRATLILEDRLNHASLIDAARYAGVRLRRYRHRDTEHLLDLLSGSDQEHKIIASDGVFSMEGTEAPLAKLCTLKKSHNTLLVVDDAHGIGVLGASGKGTLEHQQILSDQVDVLVGTFGKAFGSSGAFVATSNEIAEFLLQKSRTLIYTTAPPAALAAAAHASLKIIIQEPERRHRLHENILYFRNSLAGTSFKLQDSITPIQTIILGDNKKTLRLSEQLLNRGLMVVAIRPPTVPHNSARLRITLSSEHSSAQIDLLVKTLKEIERDINL